jgi:hypothetical protein
MHSSAEGPFETRLMNAACISAVFVMQVAFLSMAAGAHDAQLVHFVFPIPNLPPAIAEPDQRKAAPPRQFDVRAPRGALELPGILLDNPGFNLSNHQPTDG